MNYFELYRLAGFSVLPIRMDGSKGPAVDKWRDLMKRHATETECSQWASRGLGVGIICGLISGGLEVIDIDDPSLSRQWINAVAAEDPTLIGELCFVQTPRVDPETGKHGCHVFYRCDKPSGNQKLAISEPTPDFDKDGQPKKNPVTGEPALTTSTLIETRGEGGYVLTVGSPAECHPTGNLYEHVWGKRIVQLQPIHPAQRELLLRISRTFDRSVSIQYADNSHESTEDAPGREYGIKTSWDEILTPHGWVKFRDGDPVHWCRPGKSKGTSATTGLKSKSGNDLLCVFSSNAHPFDGPTAGHACSTHSKFDAFARLNYGGDHSAAARALARDGFGKQKQETKTNEKPITFQRVDQVMAEHIARAEAGGCELVSTGLRDLDYALGGGLEYGEYVIVGGRPSHGKSLATLQILDTLASNGVSSLLLSEEMSPLVLAKRMWHRTSRLSEDVWTHNTEEMRVELAEYKSSHAPIYIADVCGTIQRATEAIEKAAVEHHIKVMAVDYTQLLRGKGSTRYEQVTDVSQQLRELTSKHGILMMALCQMKRASESNNPDPRDLKDSGQLEQDADVIVFVEWPSLSDQREPEQKYLFHIRKNRNRETRRMMVECDIDRTHQTISDKSIEWEAEPGGYDQFR